MDKDAVLFERAGNWKHALNAIPDYVFIGTIEGVVIFVNKALDRKLKSVGIKTVEDLPCYEKVMTECLRDGEFEPCSLGEIEIKTLDGWFDHTMAHVEDDDGETIGFICTLRDITERKHAREQLTRSEERFRAVTSSAIDSIVISDGDGKIVNWNKAAYDMFGYEECEILDKPLSTIMPERYRTKHHFAFNETKDKLEEKYKGTYRGNVLVLEGLHKDGSEFPIELVVSSFKTSEGTFFSGIIRDVSAIEDARIKQNGQ